MRIDQSRRSLARDQTVSPYNAIFRDSAITVGGPPSWEGIEMTGNVATGPAPPGGRSGDKPRVSHSCLMSW